MYIVGKTIINHPPVITISRWYKQFPVMGGKNMQKYVKMALFYPHDISLMSIFSILPLHNLQPTSARRLPCSLCSAPPHLQKLGLIQRCASCLWQSVERDGKSFQAFSGIEMIEMVGGLPKWTLSYHRFTVDYLPYGCVSKLWRHREGKKHASSDIDSHNMEIYGNLMEFGEYNPLHPQILVGYVKL